jgi:ribose transport system substrate-binding protein
VPPSQTQQFLISLTTLDNDYQQEQAAAAEAAARRLGIQIRIIHADNDAIKQSQQLLEVIQCPVESRPAAIVFEPVGTGLPKVAQAAAAAQIGWVVLNREVDYIGPLRNITQAPIFAISTDHVEVGRIQGRQMAALLPNGGTVLHIEGPSGSSAAQQRTEGMEITKPANVEIRKLKGQWTEESANRAVSSWLRLPTSHTARIALVAGQDDSMALGARKAFEEQTRGAERERWLGLPFIGCDGLPKTGQVAVGRGLLTATVVIPTNTGLALEMLVNAIRTRVAPPEHTFTVPESYPGITALAKRNSLTKG